MIDLFQLARRNPFDPVRERFLWDHYNETLDSAHRQWVHFTTAWMSLLLGVGAVWLMAWWLNSPVSEQLESIALGTLVAGSVGVSLVYAPATIATLVDVYRLIHDPDTSRRNMRRLQTGFAVPSLPHEMAEQIGLELADKWRNLIGTPAPDREDLVWADLVQFVLLEARYAHAGIDNETPTP